MYNFANGCRSLRRRRPSLEALSHALSLLAALGKESGVMAAAVNVAFAALVAATDAGSSSSGGGGGRDAFPGALRKRRIARDGVVVSEMTACEDPI